MEAYIDNAPLWDLSHASNFSQLPDDDFLALLQKQFPTGVAQPDGGFVDGVNPQNISRYSLPSMTPPSEDSSPSPPNTINEQGGNEDSGDVALKRKASDGDFEEEAPSSKSQHTAANKKSTTTRRKSTGASGPPKDETRLLKRKEQNRAAQRAFRERKEKHVKDLEDKVAALEAKNEQALSENENLRDLLTRLQQENLTLKQSSFTFAVPKTGGTNSENAQASTSFASQSPEFTASSSSRSPISPVSSTAIPTKITNPLEWSSLTTFDPSMLNLLDDTPQPTATDGAMQMDFGFGPHPGLMPNTPFTQITSNPMFMSFASTFDSPLPPTHTNEASTTAFNNFDLNGFSSSWSSPSTAQDTSSLDDLLAVMGRGSDYSFMPTPSSTASDSPVTHHANVNQNNFKTTATQSPAFSTSSSPSSTVSDPLFDTPRDSSASDSDVAQEGHEEHNKSECPKTKGELVKRIASSGPSPFAPTSLRKSSDAVLGSMIMCEGSNFPKTQKSDQNIEVLSAWRSITSNPRFKDVDINDLCTEFTNKAKCDGTKVVLEPQGVNCILKSLSAPKK
ncbi:hypothetical protein D9615_006429 [Tricholomella constricta]|uniref:BZIP domain-containing protein n=1 Tax=Tricholomella constricta TaxID=117010 RepID=A0A8H5H5W5_9AGAR|nr:hypothetical protein D9615_006429 [Tricholomella constricta]